MPQGHRRAASHSWLDGLAKCTQCGAGTQVNQALQAGGEMAHEVHPFQDAYFMLGPYTSEALAGGSCHLYAVIDGSGDGSQALAAFLRQHLPAEILLEMRAGMSDEAVADLMRTAVLRVDNQFRSNVIADNERRLEDAQQRVQQLRGDSRAGSESELMESLAQLHSLKQGMDARCSLAMALLYSEKLYVASVGATCRALLCRTQPRRQALRFQLLTPAASPTSASYLVGSPQQGDTPLVSLTGPVEEPQDWAFLLLMTRGVFHTLEMVTAKDDRSNNSELVSQVAKALRNSDNSLLAASQSVVDNVVRLHKEAVFYAGDCDQQQVIRDDMTLLVRDFNYRQGGPGQQGSDPQQHTFLITSAGPDSAENSLDSAANSLESRYCSDLCDAYLPLHEWQAVVESLSEAEKARLHEIISPSSSGAGATASASGLSRDIIREESMDESLQSVGTADDEELPADAADAEAADDEEPVVLAQF